MLVYEKRIYLIFININQNKLMFGLSNHRVNSTAGGGFLPKCYTSPVINTSELI